MIFVEGVTRETPFRVVAGDGLQHVPEQGRSSPKDRIVKPERTNSADSTTEELEEVIRFIYLPERKVYIGSGLILEQKYKLIQFLLDNSNYFAWYHVDMKVIAPKVMTHKMNINLIYTRSNKRRETLGMFGNILNMKK